MRPKQQTLAPSGFERYRKRTRREVFLAEMDSVVPWTELPQLIEPHYPRARPRPPAVAAGAMLRMHCCSTGST